VFSYFVELNQVRPVSYSVPAREATRGSVGG
jgi:hypothetical protein